MLEESETATLLYIVYRYLLAPHISYFEFLFVGILFFSRIYLVKDRTGF